MTPEEYDAAGRIYREAKHLDSTTRAAFLDEVCKNDPRLREIVEAWLATKTATMEIAPTRRADEVSIPDRIGEFVVLGRLGEGGMGQVFLARQRHPDRPVAIKTMNPDLTISRTSIARFEAEAEYLARLHHDNIAQVYASGQRPTDHGPVPYLVMEWIKDGRSLTEFANAAGVGLEGRLRLFLQVTDAVTHAHQRGVIHRDLKPSNILVTTEVTPEGRCKVLDFGVARALEPQGEPAGDLTRRGELIGTLPYMSPEQACGRTDEIDVRTDVYALGVILFELVAGRLPFELPADRYEAVEMIVTALPPRLNALRPDVPRDLAAVVDAALAKSKERRYDSVAAFASDVRCVLEGRPVSTRPVSTWERGVYFVRRRKATAAAIGAVALGLLGSGSFGAKAYFAEKTAVAREHEATTAKRQRDALQAATIFQLGQQFAREGSWSAAMTKYDEALVAGYADPIEVQLAKVEALEGNGDVVAARRVIDELYGSNRDFGIHRARVLLAYADRTKLAGSRSEAFRGDDLLDEAIGLGTLSAADTEYAAALYARTAKLQLQHLRNALRHDSRHRRANEMIAPTLLVCGHPREALVAASEFRRLYPDDPAAQTIQLGVRVLLEKSIPPDVLERYPAVPEDVLPSLHQLVAVIRGFRVAVDFLNRELLKEAFREPPAKNSERLSVAAKFASLLVIGPSPSGTFESMFRVPPRLSETWLQVIAGLTSTMFDAGGSRSALEFLSKAMAENDDACIAYCAGVHRLLLNKDDPSYWKDFAAAAERESWLDVRKVSLTFIVLASRRHPGAVPPADTLRALRRLLHDFENSPLDYRFLWYASFELGAEAEDLCGVVFHEWHDDFPDDPEIEKAKAWKAAR
jgi:serine/threonine protein kinase